MVEPTGFREIARSATVSYPIPFIFALCLAMVLLTLGGAVVAEPPLRWVMVGFAGLGTAFAFGLVGMVVVYRPGLLRSERQEIKHRILDRISDSELTQQTIEAILDTPETVKKSSSGRRLTRRTSNEQ